MDFLSAVASLNHCAFPCVSYNMSPSQSHRQTHTQTHSGIPGMVWLCVPDALRQQFGRVERGEGEKKAEMVSVDLTTDDQIKSSWISLRVEEEVCQCHVRHMDHV